MLVAHIGVAVFIIGVSMVGGIEEEKDVRMSVGDETTLDSYKFVLVGFEEFRGPNFDSTVGIFDVFEQGVKQTGLRPEKRFYHVQQMVMTEASIDTGLTRDLYVSLGERLDDGSWIVRIYIKPFVDWIWAGAFIMALGGLVAVFDRRYRRRSVSGA